MVGESILPKQFKELRKAHSYTQDFVAASLGIVRQTYSNYETGKRTPSSEMLYKLKRNFYFTFRRYLKKIKKK